MFTDFFTCLTCLNLCDILSADVNVAELYWLLEVIERDPDTYVRYAVYFSHTFEKVEGGILLLACFSISSPFITFFNASNIYGIMHVRVLNCHILIPYE